VDTLWETVVGRCSWAQMIACFAAILDPNQGAHLSPLWLFASEGRLSLAKQVKYSLPSRGDPSLDPLFLP
jgi:hypothetical protein